MTNNSVRDRRVDMELPVIFLTPTLALALNYPIALRIASSLSCGNRPSENAHTL